MQDKTQPTTPPPQPKQGTILVKKPDGSEARMSLEEFRRQHKNLYNSDFEKIKKNIIPKENKPEEPQVKKEVPTAVKPKFVFKINIDGNTNQNGTKLDIPKMNPRPVPRASDISAISMVPAPPAIHETTSLSTTTPVTEIFVDQAMASLANANVKMNPPPPPPPPKADIAGRGQLAETGKLLTTKTAHTPEEVKQPLSELKNKFQSKSVNQDYPLEGELRSKRGSPGGSVSPLSVSKSATPPTKSYNIEDSIRQRMPHKPMVQDIKSQPVIKRSVSPIDEIANFTLQNFHQLSPQVKVAKEQLQKKFEVIKSESFIKYQEAAQAWCISPLLRTYQNVIKEALTTKSTIEDTINLGSLQNSINMEEFSAILEINKSLSI